MKKLFLLPILLGFTMSISAFADIQPLQGGVVEPGHLFRLPILPTNAPVDVRVTCDLISPVPGKMNFLSFGGDFHAIDRMMLNGNWIGGAGYGQAGGLAPLNKGTNSYSTVIRLDELHVSLIFGNDSSQTVTVTNCVAHFPA